MAPPDRPPTPGSSSLLAFQRALARDLLAPFTGGGPRGGDEGGPEEGKDGPLAGLDPARVAVHRQTVLLSLAESLEAAFPHTARRMGPDFTRVAVAHARLHPPDRPQLSAYGGGFPATLAAWRQDGTGARPPARPPAWLVDLARLEWAFLESHFAADAPPLGVDDFTGFAPDDYPRLQLTLHPAVRGLRLMTGVTTLWRDRDAGPDGVVGEGEESVLLLRPRDAVALLPLPPGGLALLEALGEGRTLEEAAGQAAPWMAPSPEAGGAPDGGELQSLLALLLGQGAFSAVSLPGG